MRLMVLGLCFCLAMVSGAAAQSVPAQSVSATLIKLHDALHLSTGQESAWRDYTGAMAPNPEATTRRHATEQLLPQLTTPRRIALIDATMEQDIADFRRQGDAVLAFYESLSPDQQQIFDRQTAPPGSAQTDH